MFSKIVRQEVEFGGKILTLETGKIARQADAAVIAQMGDTVVLCAVVAAKKPKEGIDFFPLSVHYQEKYYSAGKYPGGFHKRERNPLEREILISRLIDRPIRPLFPEGFHNEVQVTCTLLSYDETVQPDIVATIAASAALTLSGVPFLTPVAAARVGYINGEFVLNPSAKEIDEGELDLVVAGTKDAVLMVESEAKELPEDVMLKAVMFGHESFQTVIEAITQMKALVDKEAMQFEHQEDKVLKNELKKGYASQIEACYRITDKQDRYSALDEVKTKALAEFVNEEAGRSELIVSGMIKKLQGEIVRGMIIKDQHRIDGRKPSDIRPIVCEIDLLPRTHGSALFTRGETQALVITTLGSGDDEQMVDDIEGVRKDHFMLHYNFPSYSVGETGPQRAPGRREIGHGKLAFRAIRPMMPKKTEFPYTVRVVSEITESNGSSSMASVCGGSLSLMAAGVPIKQQVAGIAMGLIKESKKFEVLSDIMGDEDHLGDMDFKVAGTVSGVTALQMDIKIQGITEEIMKVALTQARAGLNHILGIMNEVIEKPQAELSKFAPQIYSLLIPKEKIGELIGPGGKNIKEIVEKSGAKIDIAEDGTVNIAAVSGDSMDIAKQMVMDVVAVPEIGKVYEGKVTKVTDFGAFVAIMRNTEGLLHVSEMAHTRVSNPRDFTKEGERLKVKVLDIDKSGKIRLSVKALITSESQNDEVQDEGNQGNDIDMVIIEDSEPQRRERDDRGDRDRNRNKRRDRDRGNRNGDRHGGDRQERREQRMDHRDDNQDNNPGGKKKRFF